MSLRILIAHSLPGQRGTQTALYIGSSGAELEAAKTTAPAHVGSFSIINNPPAIRKTNPHYDPQAKAPAAVPASEVVVKLEIPEEIKALTKKELTETLTKAIQHIHHIEEENRRLTSRMLLDVQEDAVDLPPQEPEIPGEAQQELSSPDMELLEKTAADPLSSELAV